jgi:hypothetical protein
VREHFGGLNKEIAPGLAIRHDHGSASMSDDFLQELRVLGMTSSPSFVREPEGNGVAEGLIRTLKENLLWVRHFATVAELTEALREFRRRYNREWLIERHGFRSPSQARATSAADRRDSILTRRAKGRVSHRPIDHAGGDRPPARCAFQGREPCHDLTAVRPFERRWPRNDPYILSSAA